MYLFLTIVFLFFFFFDNCFFIDCISLHILLDIFSSLSSFCLVYLGLSICHYIFIFLTDLSLFFMMLNIIALGDELIFKRSPFKQKMYLSFIRCEVMRFQWPLFCLLTSSFPKTQMRKFSLNISNCSPRFTKVTNTEAPRGSEGPSGPMLYHTLSGGKNSVVSSIVTNVFALKQI